MLRMRPKSRRLVVGIDDRFHARAVELVRLLYGFIIIRLDCRELVWIAVTRNPTADWIALQLTELFRGIQHRPI